MKLKDHKNILIFISATWIIPEACPAKCLAKCTMQYTYESCILYYTLLQRSMLHMMTWLKSPHKVSLTPVVVDNIVSDETAFCSHHTVA
jgi:hypothetical protein